MHHFARCSISRALKQRREAHQIYVVLVNATWLLATWPWSDIARFHSLPYSLSRPSWDLNEPPAHHLLTAAHHLLTPWSCSLPVAPAGICSLPPVCLSFPGFSGSCQSTFHHSCCSLGRLPGIAFLCQDSLNCSVCCSQLQFISLSSSAESLSSSCRPHVQQNLSTGRPRIG